MSNPQFKSAESAIKETDHVFISEDYPGTPEFQLWELTKRAALQIISLSFPVENYRK